MKEAKPVTELQSSREPTPAVVKDSVFFKYTIKQKEDLDRVFLLLNVSVKEGIQVYISSKEYPSEAKGEHVYAVGDVPSHVIAEYPNMYLMSQVFREAITFRYDDQSDQIVYCGTFEHTNPHLLDYESEDKLDTERLCKLTTYSKDTHPDFDWLTPFEKAGELPNKIDFMFDASGWEAQKSRVVYIGVYNSRPADGPIDFNIRIREQP